MSPTCQLTHSTDPATGLSHYDIEVIPDREGIRALGEHDLLPGMPVEALIRTEERSPLSYFVKPLADYFAKAFREE